MNKTNKVTGKMFAGIVVSDKMQNTIVVQMDYTMRHPQYKKIIKNRKKLYVENNLKAKLGDSVRVVECRPLSKLKRFTTLEILKTA